MVIKREVKPVDAPKEVVRLQVKLGRPPGPRAGDVGFADVTRMAINGRVTPMVQRTLAPVVQVHREAAVAAAAKAPADTWAQLRNRFPELHTLLKAARDLIRDGNAAQRRKATERIDLALKRGQITARMHRILIGDPLEVSVGDGKPAVVAKPGLPAVVVKPAVKAPPPAPGKTPIRVTPAAQPAQVKPAIATTPGVPAKVAIPPIVPAGPEAPDRKEPPMALDLGSLISDAASAYATVQGARNPIAATPTFSVSDAWNYLTAEDGSTVMVPRARQKRRRRRRLATMSDIRDLAALKSILGNGENFKTWIATHPS